MLGSYAGATHSDVRDAIDAATLAAPAWRDLSFDDRGCGLPPRRRSTFRPVARNHRRRNNARPVEDRIPGRDRRALRTDRLLAFQRRVSHVRYSPTNPFPLRECGIRVEYRPLEGFVYAITPFNFTAIAGNLPTAPALMGNTVIWKPSPTQAVAAYLTMQLLEAAGLPPGVINLVLGDGPLVSEVALADPRLAGIHFTGSTATFQRLWREVGANISNYRTYPRLVGETGGKDFVLAHSSADPDVLTTALIRGGLRLPGPEMFGRITGVHPEVSVGQDGRHVHRHCVVAEVRRRHRPDELRRRRHRPTFVRPKRRRDRPRQVDQQPSPSQQAATYDDREGFFISPTVLLGDDPQ